MQRIFLTCGEFPYMAEHRRIHVNVHLLHVFHRSYVLWGQAKIQRRSEHVNSIVYDLSRFVLVSPGLQCCSNSCFVCLNGLFCMLCAHSMSCEGPGNLEALKTHRLNFLRLFHIFWGPFCAPKQQKPLFAAWSEIRLGHVRPTGMSLRSLSSSKTCPCGAHDRILSGSVFLCFLLCEVKPASKNAEKSD